MSRAGAADQVLARHGWTPGGGAELGDRAWRGGLAAVLAVAAALRLVALGADVPAWAEDSAAPFLDAWWYVHAAVCAADGEPVETITGYAPPVWTSVARLWFEAFGAGPRSAHALGAAVGVAAVALTARLVASMLGRRAGLAGAALLAVDPLHVALSRSTLVYGPATLALLVAAAAWWRGARSRDPRAWLLRAAAWGLAAAVPLAVRPPAAALLGGLALGELALLHARGRRVLAPAALAAGAAALAVGVVLALDLDPGQLVSHNADRLRRYAGRLEGPVDVLERLARVGSPRAGASGSGVVALAPASAALAALGVAAALAGRLGAGRGRLGLAVLGGWGASFGLAAALMDHRPLRYFVVVAPVCAAFGGAAVFAARGAGAPRGLAWRALALAAWGAVAGPHALEVVAPRPGGAALAAAALLGGLAAASFIGVLDALASVARLAVPGALAVACIAASARTIDVASAPRDALVANALAPALVGPDAHLAGPYAALLAAGRPLRRHLAPWIRTDVVVTDRGTLVGLWDAGRQGVWTRGELVRVEVGAIRSQDLGAAATAGRIIQDRITHLALDAQQEEVTSLFDVLRRSGVQVELVGVLDGGPSPILIARVGPGRSGRPASREPEDAREARARIRALAWSGAYEEAWALSRRCPDALGARSIATQGRE